MADLRKLAREIARLEGGKVDLTIAQVSEVVGALGVRWRRMSVPDVLVEVAAMTGRAGLRRRSGRKSRIPDNG
jgi:hypothetical protein